MTKRLKFNERYVVAENGCWIWQGHISASGYGRLGSKGAHRVSYELHRGKIPSGKELDHLCRNTACVNPDHLEPVSHRENLLRSVAPCILLHLSGRCSKGHEMTQQPNGRRTCKLCDCEKSKRYRERKNASKAA